MHFVFDGEVDLQPEDDLSVTDGVRAGDLVYFERVGPREVHLRTLAPADAAGFDGRLYRVTRGAEPDTMLFTPAPQPGATRPDGPLV
jgi:hypothetical protein